ncbi:Wzz/FepE/Etk N-terminal domain-containing protein, partial [Marinilabilia sp.]
MDQLHKDSNKDNSAKQPQIIKDDEIDLVALAKTIWDGRRTIVKTTIVVVFLGLLSAFLSTEQYTTTV